MTRALLSRSRVHEADARPLPSSPARRSSTRSRPRARRERRPRDAIARARGLARRRRPRRRLRRRVERRRAARAARRRRRLGAAAAALGDGCALELHAPVSAPAAGARRTCTHTRAPGRPPRRIGALWAGVGDALSRLGPRARACEAAIERLVAERRPSSSRRAGRGAAARASAPAVGRPAARPFARPAAVARPDRLVVAAAMPRARRRPSRRSRAAPSVAATTRAARARARPSPTRSSASVVGLLRRCLAGGGQRTCGQRASPRSRRGRSPVCDF